MSCMKRHLEDCIEALAARTGYSYDFLMDKFFECLSEADQDGVEFDWNQFQCVTQEHDR